jgi:hypothetical protein
MDIFIMGRLLLSILAAFLTVARADVTFTAPAPGAVLPMQQPLRIVWTESGKSPPITELTSYLLFLCAGGNDLTTITQLAAIPASGQFTTGFEVTANIDPTIGSSAPGNA